jgi:hypothetical protein
MKTSKIWLMGGFGNVLFQILAFNVLKDKTSEVKFVDTLTKKNFITKSLGWTIHKPLYKDIINEDDVINISVFKSLLICFFAFISLKFRIKNKISNFYSSNYEINNDISNNIFGYFQSKDFLSANKNKIIQLGRELNKLYNLNDENLVVVHYRKGDSDWAKDCDDYYNKINLILENEVLPIIVVTDSLFDAEIFFKRISNLKIINSTNAIDDFKYLVSAKKIYCAPSTFSWWAAHSTSNDSEVVMPDFLIKLLGYYGNNNKLTIL